MRQYPNDDTGTKENHERLNQSMLGTDRLPPAHKSTTLPLKLNYPLIVDSLEPKSVTSTATSDLILNDMNPVYTLALFS